MAEEETRGQLSKRWRDIEQQDDEADPASLQPIKLHRLRLLKEKWFSDAFNFLIYLPRETHIWCTYWDLACPLLETFYSYFKEESSSSPLKHLWNRISEEMRCCTLCIQQHHKAQEMYNLEYEQSCISPLLDVLHTLDEERVTQHLKNLNSRIARGEYDPANDYGEVASILFEVLMFPILLDDQYLVMEFQHFIEAIDNCHELILDKHQQYLGVYALLFFKSRRVRSIGLRLAGHMDKLRRCIDLGPLQHLLKKCISTLETEGMESVTKTTRPRVQMDQITVWIGMKALIGFLEPPAFEEGILDQYPIFLSIVLNHISDDSSEFSHAINCLRLLFEKLGCKLWLRATLSPSVMRNTLMGQCFHSRNEKSHKEIFDLFQPFLQSLEALQDGEHEKQQRHFLYFLLHQVFVSSNFSILMRKKASQIALLIILRGYKMDPPSPPFECAHMWGPCLMSSLKDLSLHSSLRQPAVDLIQSVIVSDASALLSIILKNHCHSSDKPIVRPAYCEDDGEEESECALNIEERDANCWEEFSLQHEIISQAEADGSWMCAPMLWFDVLAELDPLALPLSFSKSVFWALSRFSLIEPESSAEMAIPLGNWLATCASEISYLFGWKVPSGSDDGRDGTEARNSIRISTMCLPLIRTFKRLMVHYLVRTEQQLKKQWSWEPKMSNSLILLLVDPNDNTRQVARLILEQVSGVHGLTSGLQFLCSFPSSLSALILGLRHALKLVKLDIVSFNFHALHHLFFILCKLLREGNSSTQTITQNLSAACDASKFSNQGGFLKQPLFDSTSAVCDEHPSIVSALLWKKFTCLLSQVSWPSIVKCLDVGKTFIGHTLSQMICIRLLEVIPVVFENIPKSSRVMVESGDISKWLHDLADWGRSSLAIVVRYWKQTLTLLLGLIKASCSNKSALIIYDIEKLLLHETISMDEVSKQVARLSISLIDEGYAVKCSGLKSMHSISNVSCSGRTHSSKDSDNALCDGAKLNILDSEAFLEQEQSHTIVLSDDEEELHIPAPFTETRQNTSGNNLVESYGSGGAFHPESKDSDFDGQIGLVVSSEACHRLGFHSMDIGTEKTNPETVVDKQTPILCFKAEPSDSKRKGKHIKDGMTGSFVSSESLNMKNSSAETGNSKQVDTDTSQLCSNNKTFPYLSFSAMSKVDTSLSKSRKTSDEVIKEVVRDTDADEWQFSFFKPPICQQATITKASTSVPKRQVIQLTMPVEKKSEFKRLHGELKRFNPPILDDWYKPILQFDFLAHVGFTSGSGRKCTNGSNLKKIPVCFQSPDEYIDIFRPLVLEELKAQLQNSFQEIYSSEEMCFGNISVLSVERVDEFHFVRFIHDESDSVSSISLGENDLVLITKQPLESYSGDAHAVGKVERREKDGKRKLNTVTIRLYMQGCSRLNQVRKLLNERSKWYLCRIMSIAPQLREFQALSSIREIPLHPIILNPVNQQCCQYDSRTENFGKLSLPMQNVLKSSYNDSQLQAISVAAGQFDVKDFELTLIQGPPGTGKTRTIVAIISGLLAFSQVKDAKRLRSFDQVCSNSLSTSQRISQSTAVARAWQDAALARQLNEDAEKNEKFASCRRGRILVCAQSNAAVDELVGRISSDGLYGCDGRMYKPYLVRVGNVKTLHPNSIPFFIDTLVENRLLVEKKSKYDENQSGTNVDSLMTIRSNLEKLVDHIRYYEAKYANLQEANSDTKNLVEGGCMDSIALSDTELKEKLNVLYEKKKVMYKDLANVQARERKASEEIRALRHKFRRAILKEAQIVVTTLSGCGGDLYGVCSESMTGHKFSSSHEGALFDAVVIDEAAQALEPAALIPLQLLKSVGTKCIMVGDPKQLSATVISNVVGKYSFHCSMFERLQRAGHPVIMLTQQYRMHPEICQFPSSHFYQGKLLNGDQMCRKAPFHEIWCFGPYKFFDIVDGQETRGKNAAAMSIYNECESNAAVELLRYFKKRYPSEFFSRSVGVITPYKCQLSLLRSQFLTAFGSSITEEMEFNTVDGFQGREVDILLLSTVRATGSSSDETRVGSSNLGFVADVRRMNVALTRAKHSLWIFGNAKTLQTNHDWAALVKDAKQRNLIVAVRKPYSKIFSSAMERTKSSENVSGKSSRLERTEKINAASDCMDIQRKNVKHSTERKRKMNASVSDISCAVEDASPAGKDTAKENKSKASYGRSASSLKDISLIAAKHDDKMKEHPVNGYVTSDRDTGVETEAKDNSSNLGNSGKLKSRNQRHLKSEAGLVCLETTIKPNARQQRVKEGSSLSEIILKEKDVVVSSDQTEIPDSLTKRKQQREAVDALLSTALISSKKTESNKLKSSVKRTISTKDAKDYPLKLQKPKKY